MLVETQILSRILSTIIRLFTLFAYSSHNFYGATICIKAVYSPDPHCKRSSVELFLSRKILIVFDVVPEKVGKPTITLTL